MRSHIMAAAVLASLLIVPGIALGEVDSHYVIKQVRSLPLGPTSVTFLVEPFDPSLGTLNSVTMYAEVNVSGSAQLWTTEEDSTLTYSFKNTLAAIPELGWGTTVATYSGSEYLYNWDAEWGGEASTMVSGSGNTPRYTTITAGFGRFAGALPFAVQLSLTGTLSSSNASDILASAYDGNATLMYDYDYTLAEIPEPASIAMTGVALISLAGLRRRA